MFFRDLVLDLAEAFFDFQFVDTCFKLAFHAALYEVLTQCMKVRPNLMKLIKKSRVAIFLLHTFSIYPTVIVTRVSALRPGESHLPRGPLRYDMESALRTPYAFLGS